MINDFSLHHQGRNLHLIPGEGVEVNNSQVSCNTSSAPKQNKEQPVKQQSSKSKQSKQKKENIDKSTRSTFIAGDSILKDLSGCSFSGPPPPGRPDQASCKTAT